MNTKEIIRREKEHFKIITGLEQDLKNEVNESRRTAINSKISQENAAFRKFSITVLKEKINDIDRTLKQYAEHKAILEKEISSIDKLQKIVVADRVATIKVLKEFKEDV